MSASLRLRSLALAHAASRFEHGEDITFLRTNTTITGILPEDPEIDERRLKKGGWQRTLLQDDFIIEVKATDFTSAGGKKGALVQFRGDVRARVESWTVGEAGLYRLIVGPVDVS